MHTIEAFVYNESYPFLVDSVQLHRSHFFKLRLAARALIDIYPSLRLHPGSTVLDVGCNIGTLGHYLKFAGVKTYGIDINQAALEEGKRLFGYERNNRKIHADAGFIPFGSNFFDSVFSYDFFEHLNSKEEAAYVFGEMERVCRGNRMVHKITVLEDTEYIHRDKSHMLKRSSQWWNDFFESHNWMVVSPTTRTHIMPSKKGLDKTVSYGFFVIKKA